MIDVSNKILAILFGIFIVISAIGLFVGEGRITGMASVENETGNVTATVIADIDINATDESIDFGNVLNTWINRSEDVPGDKNGSRDNITIQNVGKTIADIDYWANQSIFDKKNGTIDADNPNKAKADDSYKIRILENGTCGEVNITIYTNVSIGYGNMTDLIADCSQDDEFTVGIQIYVPEYELSGGKSSMLYFRATEYTG